MALFHSARQSFNHPVFLPINTRLFFCIVTVDLLLPSAQPQQQQQNSTSLPPLSSLSTSLHILSQQLSAIQSHVQSITSKPNGPDANDIEVGKYLLEAVGRWKEDARKESGSGKGLTGQMDGSEIEGEDGEGVKKGLQDVLSISYLSALLRSQVELGARLNLLT